MNGELFGSSGPIIHRSAWQPPRWAQEPGMTGPLAKELLPQVQGSEAVLGSALVCCVTLGSH